MAAAADDSRAAPFCYGAVATICFSIACYPSNLLRSAASALCFFAVNAIAIKFLILYLPPSSPSGKEVPPPPPPEVFKDKKVVHVETVCAQPPRRRRTCGNAAGRASTMRAASGELQQSDSSENRRRRQRRSAAAAPLEPGTDDDIFSEASVIARGADRGGDRREHSLPSAAPAPTYTMHPTSLSAPPAPAEWPQDESSENRRRSPPVVLFMELGMLDDLDGEEFRQLVEAFVAEQLDALFEYKESRAAAGEGDGPAGQGQSVGDVDVEPNASPAPACTCTLCRARRRRRHRCCRRIIAALASWRRLFCSPRVNKAAYY